MSGKKEPRAQGVEARGPSAYRGFAVTAPARELVEFQGPATERKKAARRRPFK
jgi:hypothetical protein